ncbi:pirin family protein [Thalassotalea sp. M1531]|uniref:Pirin family protein n=1 Tax=Thalassotalea algicola TaxID=2716224 RepID=A0A7Y0Q5G5_9GAMM|nr:pirin family protein [Thalassotalea algicola]NMP30081.1 pirin family protein [Thalassotalea algicola]
MARIKELRQITNGMPASDGAGVKLTRLIGTPDINILDPFLMLDSFESDQAQDYIAGFPPHPHRGFETVTYMLAGKMRHKDSAGNEGVIEKNGVQWMTAGKGIIHSEMPEQESGLMQGFQLWINLPASHKMSAPAYQDFPATKIATEQGAQGQLNRVVAGVTDNGTKGAVQNNFVKPTYMDISLPQGTEFTQSLSALDNSFIYVIDGEISIGMKKRTLVAKQLGVLTQGDAVSLNAVKESRILLLSAQPLNEPVAKGGPFVMNTQQEVLQAFKDYENGRFV